ncbi:MAG: phosphodiesterase [Burkholderiales bacterium]|nr:phosphodiesterase [Burkholderiales bacterium]
MNVISHRGWWLHADEKNTVAAFERSFAAGYGTETDVRDLDGQLVVSHDMPRSSGALPLAEVLGMAQAHGVTLALNIKSDGLAEALREETARFPSLRWFAFDMSVPDMRSHLRTGNPTYTRLSDIESSPAYLERCSGIWLDALETEWLDEEKLRRIAAIGKPICMVSPELHGRDPGPAWSMLRSFSGESLLTLCTDLPREAETTIKGAPR